MQQNRNTRFVSYLIMYQPPMLLYSRVGLKVSYKDTRHGTPVHDGSGK